MRASSIAICCAAGLLAVGCSNPDNLVVGGILGSGSVPNATITVVGSALNGTGTLTDSSGNHTQRALVLLSDIPNLCATLTTNPHFFDSPTSGFTVLVMSVPAGMVGTFYPGAQGTSAGLFASAMAGGNVYGYPGVGGTVVLSEFDTQAQGYFDIQFVDTASNQYEVYGNFKTTGCDALASASIPQLGFAQ